MSALRYRSEINEVRDEIINRGLTIGTLVGFLTYGLSLLPYLSGDSQFELSFITDLVVLLLLSFVTLRRHKLSINTKSYAVLLFIFLVVFVDVYEIGILSANKTLLILIPFFAVISMTLKRSLIYFGVVVVCIGVLAYLHITDTVQPIDSARDQDISFAAWMINLLIIILVSAVMLLVVKRFNGKYEELIDRLVASNDRLRESEDELHKHQHQLEKLVARRTRKLEEANEQLSIQTQELSNALERLSSTQNQLVQSEKMASLGLLASGVAHEINNPLNFIKGGITGMELFLKEELGDKNSETVDMLLKGMNDGVSRATEIVTSLTRYSYSKDELTDKCNLNEILENCLVMLKNQLKNRIEILREYDRLEPIVVGNNGKLHQVFLNLLTNASHAMDESGTLSVRTELKEKVALVEIRDTGHGIPDGIMGKIADPFFTTKEIGVGTGLGLYIVHNIIGEHKGLVEIDSKKVRGPPSGSPFPWLSYQYFAGLPFGWVRIMNSLRSSLAFLRSSFRKYIM